MADSALKLPGKFEAGKKYLLDGAILKAWQAALLADRVIPGAGLTEQGTPQGRIFKAGATGSTPPTGAFFGLTTVGGITYLQGGSVSAGDGSDTIANIALTNSSGVPLHTAGDHLYMNALGDGILTDGVILAGFNLTSATVGYAATVPGNTLPLAAGATGKRCYIDLGVFTATGFLPNQPGNIGITYCPGGYTVTRY